jgi:hypothetical protein
MNMYMYILLFIILYVGTIGFWFLFFADLITNYRFEYILNKLFRVSCCSDYDSVDVMITDIFFLLYE